MLTIGLTVIYLTFLVIYFSVAASVKNSEIFKCSNVFWLLLVSASFVVSLVFVATGAIVSTSMKDITRKDLKQKEKNLWVLIGVSVASRMVGLGENIVFILKDYDNCFIYVGNIDLEFVIFSLLKMITDYSVMFTVLYQFQKHDYKDSSSLRSLAMEDLKRPETEENIKTKMQNYFSPIRAKLPKKIPL